jgi:UDP-glucose 4-epimerase
VASFLVTGGAGFIGSHLVDALVSSGGQVRVLDNLSTGSLDNLGEALDRIEFIQGDITDPPTVSRAVEGVDHVFHEAALVSVPLSMENPEANHRINVNGTFALLQASRAAGVKRFVFAGSCAAYGGNPAEVARETDTPEPGSPYALAKLAGEGYCRLFDRMGWLETVVLRYFNVFGPRQDPESPYSAVVPLFATRLLGGQPPVIHGDGGQTRDFVYVKDVIQANLLAMTSTDAHGGVFNVGTGESRSVKELANCLSALVPEGPGPVHEGARAGDIRDSRAGVEAARRTLGFEAAVPFDEGLARTVEWYRRQESLQDSGGSS